ncbi:retrovirus-related pol polyprotein from transposon TNT 1-94 [Tanacetum coccineum]
MFLGVVRFGNDHVAAILGFGDLQWGNLLITRVYFVEGLGHNLFSVGQFCDSDLEVAFRRNSCFVRSLEGVDLLKGNRSTNFTPSNLHDNGLCIPNLPHALSSKLLQGMVMASTVKSKRHHTYPNLVPNSKQRLHLLHMDLCGPMRIASINGKRYVLVIVDDYSRYTWVHFLRSKDEAPEVIKTFLKRITVLLQSPVIIIRTDNGTEFKNQFLKEYWIVVGISHQAVFCPYTQPKWSRWNGRQIERWLRLLESIVDFSHLHVILMGMILMRLLLVLHSIIAPSFTVDLTKHHTSSLMARKPDISFLHVFGALCYPKIDREVLGSLVLTNSFSAMAFDIAVQKPGLKVMTSGQISSDSILLMLRHNNNKLRIPTEGCDEIETQQHGQHQPATIADNVPNAMFDENTFVNPFATPSTSDAASSSSQYVDPSNMHNISLLLKAHSDNVVYKDASDVDILVVQTGQLYMLLVYGASVPGLANEDSTSRRLKGSFRYLRGTVYTAFFGISKDSGIELNRIFRCEGLCGM